MPSSIRVAHISDLHLRHHLPGTATITTRLSRQMPELFARALEYIHAQAPDLLVVSGDLTDYPLEQLNDPVTQAQGEADLRLIADLLANMACPIALVYGNHDHPALTRQVFAHLPADQVCAQHRVLCFYDDEGPGHVPQRVGAERAKFIRAVADSASLPQIHVQHYLVWPEENEESPHTYGDGIWLRDQIIHSGHVRLVLSGHYHRGVPLFRIRDTWFAGARAFCEAPHPFYIYEVEDSEMRIASFLTIQGEQIIEAQS